MTNIYQPIWINFISKDWEELIFNEYVAGPEGQPNIGCWPRGPEKVCRPRNEAVVKRLTKVAYIIRLATPRIIFGT